MSRYGLWPIVLASLLPVWMFGQAVIRVDVRMVEVYAAVTDDRNQPVKNLRAEDFQIFEDGRPQDIRIFETSTSAMTIALLVDTTGSVAPELPHVKNAIGRLLTSLKAEDSVGLFTFATNLTPLSPFTVDRKVTLGAILQTRPAGATALFDSLAQLSRQISKTNGKKAILLFTDGDDNSSVLSLDSALQETRRVGVPIYAMLYGRAVTDSALLRRLEEISKATGGTSFRIRRADDLPTIFQNVASDLQHHYLLGYQSDRPEGSGWRSLKVEVRQPKTKVIVKDGYSN